MRQGNWELCVTVGGRQLQEHDIDGHKCICSEPGEKFELQVRYHGSEGQFSYDVFIDGKDTSGAHHWFDPEGRSSKGRKVERTLKGWEKVEHGNAVKRAFVFETVQAAGGSEDSRPAAVDWSRGFIRLIAYDGELHTRRRDRHASHKADASSHAAPLDEQTMVKSGLSTTAGAGDATFHRAPLRRAGEVTVRRTKQRRVVTELDLFYRDSFFMCLREDKCCGGECARQRAEQAGPTVSAQLGKEALRLRVAGGVSGTQVRDRLVAHKETTERLARKRPAAAEPIDLTVSDDEEKPAIFID